MELGGSKELSSVKRAWAAGPGMTNTELCICWLALLPVGGMQPSLVALKNVVENALDRSCSHINADFCKIVLLHANREIKRLRLSAEGRGCLHLLPKLLNSNFC